MAAMSPPVTAASVEAAAATAAASAESMTVKMVGAKVPVVVAPAYDVAAAPVRTPVAIVWPRIRRPVVGSLVVSLAAAAQQHRESGPGQRKQSCLHGSIRKAASFSKFFFSSGERPSYSTRIV